MESPKINEEIARLNDEQKEAVDTIDGPVLVVAGPGTGKTQLLSLRVVNILANRDVTPANILCLTYTDAGAQAMTKRLTQFIGKDAYSVQINTFHAFASFLRMRYPEYFSRSVFDSLITDLQSRKRINELLNKLSIGDPLYQKPFNKVSGNLGDVKNLIGKIKRSGLSVAELRAVVNQNLETIEYLTEETDMVSKMLGQLPGKSKKVEYLDKLQEDLLVILQSVPTNLKEECVSLVGSYKPYGIYLEKLVAATEMYEGENNKATGFLAFRDKLIDKGKQELKDKTLCQKLLSTLEIFEKYQTLLDDSGLYDFDDMILDAISAIESHDEFKTLLQSQYQYILVDEFQDTNGSQMQIIELLTEGIDHPNILAVGDDDQAIMRFQGASVAFLDQFEQKYAGTKRIVLKTNYRSTPSLVDLGQMVAKQIEGRALASQEEKSLTAFRSEAEKVNFEIDAFASPEIQYYCVAQSIRESIDNGLIEKAKNPDEAIAVIAWKRKSLEALIPYLKMFDIDYVYDVQESVGKISSLQSLLASMRYVFHIAAGDIGQADPWLPQIISAPELGITEEAYIEFAIDAKKEGWTQHLRQHKDPSFQKLYGRLSKCAKQSMNASARKVICDLAEPMISYYKSQAESDPFTLIEFNYGLEALLRFTESEIASSSKLDPEATLVKLADVIVLLDEAVQYQTDIKVSIPISRPQAVTLTTAHSSKGLEYDQVYLLDVDEKTWHGNSKPSIVSENIYLSESRDEDDMRRLLFVAITRAKNDIAMSLGKSEVVSELLGLTENKTDALVSDVLKQSEVVWQNRYVPKNLEAHEAFRTMLNNTKISASLLNKFVQYRKDGVEDNSEFIIDCLFGFPRPPAVAFEFGTLVHAFLEEYINQVVKGKAKHPEELYDEIHTIIDRMDFPSSDIGHMHERFDMIVQKFIPTSKPYLQKDALAEQWINATVDGIKLTGRSDLLLFDEAKKEITVCDYKTGSKGKHDVGYERQLVFYKILIEESGSFPGWKVRRGMDIFVEPDKRDGWNVPSAEIMLVPSEDVDHVRSLIKVLHYRMQHADFDVSGFVPAATKPEAIQEEFEEWLIVDYEKGLGKWLEGRC